jgi:hypothetical protein
VPAKSLKFLRISWFIFGFLLLSNIIANLIAFPNSYHIRLSDAVKVIIFGILIISTYKNVRYLWFFAIVVISLKMISLLKFYTTQDYRIMSVLYYEEYTGLLFRLKLQAIALLLFGNNLFSAALLLGSYSYWLYMCENLLQGFPNKYIKS